MFAVIDCGTTNTRVYILNDKQETIGVGTRKVGVRNTSMTGSKDTLRQGVCEAILEAVESAGIALSQLDFAIASGMITSEIGLMEIPHLIAPVGLEDLATSVKVVPAGEILPLDIPILFIRGIRNDYGEAILQNIRHVDFMRGEETQVMGILDEFKIDEAVNIIVLSSHTKLIHINAQGQITASLTTISGQLYEAVCKETMIGKSLIRDDSESAGGYSFEEGVRIANEVTQEVGLDRSMLIPRLMQVLLKTDYKERNLFIDAAIAADDMRLIAEFERQGHFAQKYILFGHASRCKIYAYLLEKHCPKDTEIVSVSDPNRLAQLTVRGAMRIATRYQETHEHKNQR